MTPNDADRNHWQRRLRAVQAQPKERGRIRKPSPRTLGLLVLALIIGGGVAASFERRSPMVDPALPGVPVPASHVKAINQAALSCPTLTGPRVAAQVMAASGFNANASATNGGSDIAGLTDEQWQRWIPWPNAPRMDPTASITALAHHMCDLVGELRRVGMNGDLWPIALAAHQAGLNAVLTAKAIPSAVTGYVERVSGYAVWYTRQPEFGSDVPDSSPSGAPAVTAKPRPVPDEYVAAVTAAGRTCQTMTPPRIAAQLMAASGFNPNLIGTNGGQGIAQFLPAVWNKYGAAGQSPWDPMVAIPALGRTMCGLSNDLAGFGTDAYPMALAAFQWGSDAVQQAGGVPNAPNIREFNARVLRYVDYYAKDPRLGGPPTSLAASSPAPPAAAAGSNPPPASGGSTPPGATKPVGPVPSTTKPGVTTAPPAATSGYMIVGYGGKCVSVPGNTAIDGTQLQMRDCTGAAGQRWTNDGNGSLRALGMCMDLAWASSTNGTKVQLARCNGGWAQRFLVNNSHDLVNSEVGKCVDVRDWSTANGALLQLWDCAGTANQKFSKKS
ncbi:ricin-type beta-trefoil lectin domain protein [Dactylosporangium sp. NPDC005572]|uniref:ricin-type beta-trefoil lectin domain protein n=1 Tax=Dactylosporangium sp. NPDC005572 TaxID=3156889 RepID=UPI00339F0723